MSDGIGGLGSTTTYQVYSASAVRSGGVLPDSLLLCAVGRAYPKPFCGTDAEGATLEYRIDEAAHPRFEFILFTEDLASRVLGAEAFAFPNFRWHPDSGIGVVFHGFRLDVARGQAGSRLTFELQGELY